VKIRFGDQQPTTTWQIEAPEYYAFYVLASSAVKRRFSAGSAAFALIVVYVVYVRSRE